MKRILALLLLAALLSGCAPQPQASPQSTSPNQPVLTLSQELEQARQVTMSLEIPALAAFEASALALRDHGLDFLGYGMTRQASYCFSFAGANVTALRLAAQQIAGQKPTGFSDWDTVAAISYASPVPLLCEAIAAEHAGDPAHAQGCREMAVLNENTVAFAGDLQCLTSLSDKQLSSLIEKLIAFENHLYWFYPADPIAAERCGMEWSPAYHLQVAGALETLGYDRDALPYYLDALAQDPFDPELFLLCAKAMYKAGEIQLMRTYLEEGLLMEPDHPGLNAWSALLWLAAGDGALAQTHLDTALAGKLSEEDAAVCKAVEKAMKGG